MSATHHCPFCGSGETGFSALLFRVVCLGCDAIGPRPQAATEEEAVKAWNAWIDNLLSTIKKMEGKVAADENRAHHHRPAGNDTRADGTRGW